MERCDQFLCDKGRRVLSDRESTQRRRRNHSADQEAGSEVSKLTDHSGERQPSTEADEIPPIAQGKAWAVRNAKIGQRSLYHALNQRSGHQSPVAFVHERDGDGSCGNDRADRIPQEFTAVIDVALIHEVAGITQAIEYQHDAECLHNGR